jgi:hypothetical protein
MLGITYQQILITARTKTGEFTIDYSGISHHLVNRQLPIPVPDGGQGQLKGRCIPWRLEGLISRVPGIREKNKIAGTLLMSFLMRRFPVPVVARTLLVALSPMPVGFIPVRSPATLLSV